MIHPERVATANVALKFFAPETWIEVRAGRIYCCWKTCGKDFARPWATRRGQDFYPVWYGKWCHGGTCSTALSQLVRWIRDDSVLPLSTWRYWCSETVRLARDSGADLIQAMKDGGYPDEVRCCLCGERIMSFDWWSLDGVSGPCCNHNEGCRQKGKIVA